MKSLACSLTGRRAAVTAARARERRQLTFSFICSLITHLLFILLFAGILALGLRSARPLPNPTREQQIEVTFIPPPSQPSTTLEKKPELRFVDTGSAPEAKEAPTDARFESDKNTRAASENPASGTVPLPSQEGRESDFLELENRNLSLAPPQPPAPLPASGAAQTSELSESQMAPDSLPAATPAPTPHSKQEEIRRPPRADELAIGRPVEVRRAESTAPHNASQEIRRAQPLASSRPTSPGFQPERRTTRITGGINNRGPSSVDAVGTPLGKYKKALSDAIGSRWYYYVSDQISILAVGTLTIRFTVLQSGKVVGLQVLRNSSNESFASVSIRAILEADIPPIPPDVAQHLENNAIEVDYTFSILAN
jgi:hypothetical protein